MRLILSLLLIAPIITFFETYDVFAAPQTIVRHQNKKLFFIPNSGTVPYPLSLSNDQQLDKRVIVMNPLCDKLDSSNEKEQAHSFSSYYKKLPEDVYYSKIEGSSTVDESAQLFYGNSEASSSSLYQESDIKSPPVTESPGLKVMELSMPTFHPERSGIESVETMIMEKPLSYEFPFYKEDKVVVSNEVSEIKQSMQEAVDSDDLEENNMCYCNNGEVVAYNVNYAVKPAVLETPLNEKNHQPVEGRNEEPDNDLQPRAFRFGERFRFFKKNRKNRPKRTVEPRPQYATYISSHQE